MSEVNFVDCMKIKEYFITLMHFPVVWEPITYVHIVFGCNVSVKKKYFEKLTFFRINLVMQRRKSPISAIFLKFIRISLKLMILNLKLTT